jgi:hypothetical protein
MAKLYVIFHTLFIVLFVCASCSYEELTTSNSKESLDQTTKAQYFFSSDHDVVLKYQPDPYTLENFQKAYDLIADNGDVTKTRGLNTTHILMDMVWH